jgi:reactive intermediate/imine deaminase
MTTQVSESNPRLTEVRCADAPPAGGHYVQGMLHGTTLYVSGQLGVTRDTPNPAEVRVADQVAFALGNIERIARVVGAARSDVTKCTVFVTGLEHWEEVNRAWAAFFGTHRPARSVVPCAALHFGAKVEIEAIIAVGGG